MKPRAYTNYHLSILARITISMPVVSIHINAIFNLQPKQTCKLFQVPKKCQDFIAIDNCKWHFSWSTIHTKILRVTKIKEWFISIFIGGILVNTSYYSVVMYNNKYWIELPIIVTILLCNFSCLIMKTCLFVQIK